MEEQTLVCENHQDDLTCEDRKEDIVQRGRPCRLAAHRGAVRLNYDKHEVQADGHGHQDPKAPGREYVVQRPPELGLPVIGVVISFSESR